MNRGLLIVNADDFGASAEATDAIASCFARGRISSSSAMVHMADTDRAAELARQRRLALGLHLNLTQPFTDAATPPKVRQRHAEVVAWASGRVRRRRVMYDPAARSRIEATIADQLGAFEAAFGGPPTHVDGHHHAHLSLNVLLARTLPAGTRIRNAQSEPQPSPALAFPRWVRRTAIARRFVTTDWVFELSHEALPQVLELSRNGTVELVVHPQRVPDLAFLMSDEWGKLVSRRRLGTFLELDDRSIDAATIVPAS